MYWFDRLNMNSSQKEPLIKPPRGAILDLSGLQIQPANTMANPLVYQNLEKDERCCPKSVTQCVYISACSCGIASIVFTFLH